MSRLLAAPDKFRGTATAPAVAEAICRGAARAGWETASRPMADGGEGTLEVLGGRSRWERVAGPLGDPVEAEWRLLEGRARRGGGPTAVVEMARASGLSLVGGPDRNDPVGASTTGTGQLIAAAVTAGARKVVVAVGGSATTDGGLGAVEALAPRTRWLAGVELVVACDVQTRFVEAAATFGPQKGATSAQVALLTRRLERLVQLYRERFGVDVADLPGSGAAGGLAGGLAAVGARLVPGFDLVADTGGLDEAVTEADLVVTGEGFLDQQSFEGKVVGGVLERSRRLARPVLLVVGGAEGGLLTGDPGARRLVERPETAVVSLVEAVGRDRAFHQVLAGVEDAVVGHLGALPR